MVNIGLVSDPRCHVVNQIGNASFAWTNVVFWELLLFTARDSLNANSCTHRNTGLAVMDGDPAVEAQLDGFSLVLPLPYRVALIIVLGTPCST